MNSLYALIVLASIEMITFTNKELFGPKSHSSVRKISLHTNDLRYDLRY